MRKLNLTVGEMEDIQAKRSSDQNQQPESGAVNLLPRLGLELAPLSSSQQKEFGITGGLLVIRVEGASANSGIREGDVVLALNNHDIKKIEQLKELMKKYKKSRSVALLVKRGEGSIYVPIRLD